MSTYGSNTYGSGAYGNASKAYGDGTYGSGTYGDDGVALASGAYWIAHPDSAWPPGTPTDAQIAAGKLSDNSPAAYAGSETAPGSGSGTITEATAVTGLTASTAYRIAWVVYDDVALRYSNVVVGTESTLAALITGTLAATEAGADTAVLSGQVRVQGALAALESGADTASLAGQIIVGGSLAAAEVGSDTALIRYIPPGTGADPAEVWRYVLSNGLTAEENLVENNRMLRIVLAAVSGTTSGIGSQTEIYFGEDGTTPRVVATFDAQGNRLTVRTDGAP